MANSENNRVDVILFIICLYVSNREGMGNTKMLQYPKIGK